MNRFLKYWRLTACGEAFCAHVIAYADDFVILSRGCAAEALAWTRAVMTRLGLTLNEAKTSLKNARQERFDFLGYSFGPHRYKANGLWYLSASPSKKSMQRFKTKVGNLLVPGNNDPWPEVRDTLNRSLLGWSNYFCHGTRRSAFRGVDRYVYERVRDFLARRHSGRAWHPPILPRRCLWRTRSAASRTPAPNGPAACLTVKLVGEPDALIGHRPVR
jgi:RNA-directed DNA polymerase